MQIRAVTWNLFHGRDFPPDRSLRTWRSRLLKISERGGEYVQVNRNLFTDFTTALVALPWDLALLQECPPRWAKRLAEALGAETHRVLTSRNWVPWLQGAIADLNPDLIASSEGGSNLTLIRGTLLSGEGGSRLSGEAAIVERRELEIHSGPLERRTMAFTRTAAGLCVANLHATTNRPAIAGPEVLEAAATAVQWAGEDPLLFGGDLNLRPVGSPEVFERMRDEHGLAAATGPRAIDHLLARGLEILEPPTPLPHPEVERPAGYRGPLGIWRREAGHQIRLSDHAPVGATYELGEPSSSSA